MINAANNLLAAIEKVNDANFVGGRKKEIIAEARFLRAFGSALSDEALCIFLGLG